MRAAFAACMRVTLFAPLVMVPAVQAADSGASVRPEVGRPLQAARDLMKAQRYKDAQAKVAEADAVPGKTAYESYVIQRMRGSIAAAEGDTATAAQAFEAVINSSNSSAQERLQLSEALAGLYYRSRDYSHAISWAQRYLKDGGTDAAMRTVLVQAYYLAGDCAGVAREASADDHAGHPPTEDELQMLANCYAKASDKAGYASAMERLVAYYPKKDYWIDVLSRLRLKPGFSERLDIDLFRLKLAVGILTATGDYMEMAQLALQDGATGEAKKIIDQGFASGALGSGSDAERQKRLQNLALRQLADDQKNATQVETDARAAPDGSALVRVGYALVTSGQAAHGLDLMNQGIAKDALKYPEVAKLHLGLAYLQAGQKAKAREVLKTVRGTDGTQDLARLWLVAIGSAN